MARECRCGTCPGYYLVGHMCTCSCHRRPLPPIKRPLESVLSDGEGEQASEHQNGDEMRETATQVPLSEDVMDVSEPLESEAEAYSRERDTH